MATFPGAVKTFTTKSDGAGNKIFAAHVNEIQDEVNAIEDALLNASAPLSLSSLTVTGFHATAGSSLAGTLHVTGASTFVGAVSLPAVEAIRLELAADAAIAAASTVAIAWTVQSFATNSSLHSTSSNPSRVSPQSTGVFLCHAALVFNTATSTLVQVQIEDSSGTMIARTTSRPASGSVSVEATGLKYIDTVAANPYVRVVVIVNSTNSVAASTAAITHFSVTKLR